MSFYDVWTTLISPSCPVVFFLFFWFSVFFCFILITDKSSPCPHNNPVFSSVRLIIPALRLFFFGVQICDVVLPRAPL